MKKIIKTLSRALLLGALLLTGCASKEVKIEDPNDFRTANQKKFDSADKPSTEVAITGTASGDLITSSIAGTYEKTLALKLQQDERLSSSNVATRLEDIRKTQGAEAEQKAINNLTAEEQAEYAVFLKNSVNELAVALEYSMEAAKMAAGILTFDINEYVTNPFAIISSLKAINTAKDQLDYTQLALRLMIEDHNRYEESITLLGK
ncbi:MAG: hypothetical protein PSN04_11025 [Methyloprofundus sp.]|nr:hypothetical protein [Methyloprofundus sp.]